MSSDSQKDNEPADPNGSAGIVPGTDSLNVEDRLSDSFPLLPGESQWLMALLGDDLARILNDE